MEYLHTTFGPSKLLKTNVWYQKGSFSVAAVAPMAHRRLPCKSIRWKWFARPNSPARGSTGLASGLSARHSPHAFCTLELQPRTNMCIISLVPAPLPGIPLPDTEDLRDRICLRRQPAVTHNIHKAKSHHTEPGSGTWFWNPALETPLVTFAFELHQDNLTMHAFPGPASR